jgi:hypothetical protein
MVGGTGHDQRTGVSQIPAHADWAAARCHLRREAHAEVLYAARVRVDCLKGERATEAFEADEWRSVRARST